MSKIEGATKAALSDADFRTWLSEQGLDPSGLLGERFRAFTEAELAKYSKIVRDTNIQPR